MTHRCYRWIATVLQTRIDLSIKPEAPRREPVWLSAPIRPARERYAIRWSRFATHLAA